LFGGKIITTLTLAINIQCDLFTFLAFSNSLTVMLPVPGPTSKTTSVGLSAAWKDIFVLNQYNNYIVP